MGFVHLHLHSEYSLLDGACRVADIPKTAAELGQKAVAITDHGVMYGVVSFYNACKAAGIKPIIGCEVYVAQKTRFDKSGSGETEPNHLVLLVKNEIGYKNLIKMVSKAFTEGFYRKPRVDMELLSEHSEGLICLSGCLAGRISGLIMDGAIDLAEEYALKLNQIFGKGNFYLEIQNHGLDGQRTVNECLYGISKRIGIPLVATNDVHYLKREDSSTQATMMCIQMNTRLSDGRPLGFESDEFYMKSEEEMLSLFGMYDEAVLNTEKIADMCNFEFSFGKTVLPKFTPPEGVSDNKKYLKQLALEGLERRVRDGDVVYSDDNKYEDYKLRIEYEYLVVCSMGYTDYYLIVADFVGYAKQHGIMTGPGRGSGAGSLLAYLIGITEVDPVKYNLLFEAFLNKQRISMPDFDIDFCDRRRDEVIAYVSRKYGEDHVAQIVTFGTMAPKAALRDVGRVKGISYADVDETVKAFSEAKDTSSLSSALKDERFRALYDSNVRFADLIDTAISVEGMPRNASTHAAGVVITDRPISEYVPLSVNGNAIVTQFDMDTVASLGLLKFDFLAIRYLTIISDVENEIRKTNPAFDIEHIPMDDSETYYMISKGRTDGLFQLESGGMTKLLVNIKPKDISDIMTALALHRPGPMEFIDTYLKNRADPSKISYKIDCLSEILSETYGCILYQEQIMQILRDVAGYTYGKADIVRRAISKKKTGVIEQERENFLRGAIGKGYDKSDAEELYSVLPAFANYGFKKSHAAAYAIVSYRTAYLKCHYPQMYYSALISSVFGNTAKMSEYITQASKLGIKILPPDINESGTGFSVSGNNIRYGLSAIKKVGETFIDKVILERQKRKFTSFVDFITRMNGSELNKPQLENLIKAGVFDSLGEYRSRLLASLSDILSSIQSETKAAVAGQFDLFATEKSTFKFPQIPELSKRERLLYEKESSGMYFSGNILDEYSENILYVNPMPIANIVIPFSDGQNDGLRVREKQRLGICGELTAVSLKTTKNGDIMSFATIDDGSAELELVIFPKVYSVSAEIIFSGSLVCIFGEVSLRDGKPSLVVLAIEALTVNGKFESSLKSKMMMYLHGSRPNMMSNKEQMKSSYVDEREVNSVSNRTSSIKEHAKCEKQGSLIQSKDKETRKKIYIRVKDMNSQHLSSAMAIARIFEGDCDVIVFDMSSGKYFSSGIKTEITEFLLNELKKILGSENIALK